MKALAVGLIAAATVCGRAGAQQVCTAAPESRSSASVRFQDGTDGTVTDKESKLMWMRCSSGQSWSSEKCVGEPATLSWTAAQSAAADENRSGRMFFNDWRLPSLRELATIAERRCRNPRLDLSVFPDSPARPYWSATSRPGGADESAAYALDFGADGVRLSPKERPNLVRLVRSAQ